MSTPSTPSKPQIVSEPNAVAWEVGGSVDDMDGLSHYLCTVLLDDTTHQEVTLTEDGILSVPPAADGNYTCYATAVDVSGHSSMQSPTSDPIAVSLQRPVCTLTTEAVTGSNAASATVFATFTDASGNNIPVTGLSVTGFIAVNAAVGNLTEVTGGVTGSVYSLNLKPINDGAYSVYAIQGAASGANTRQSKMSNRLDFSYYASRPEATLTHDGNVSSYSYIDVYARFSDPVTGFGITSVNVTGGTVSDVTGSAAYYVIRLAPTAGTGVTLVQAQIPAGIAVNQWGNSNLASDTMSIYHNSDVPVAEHLRGMVI